MLHVLHVVVENGRAELRVAALNVTSAVVDKGKVTGVPDREAASSIDMELPKLEPLSLPPVDQTHSYSA